MSNLLTKSLDDTMEHELDLVTSPDPLSILIDREEQAEELLYEALYEFLAARKSRKRFKQATLN